MEIKVINAGNCMMCGREIKIVTKKDDYELPNIFFCPECERRRVRKTVNETLKRDGFGYLMEDDTCKEKQDQTRDEKMIDAIDLAIEATDTKDDYSMGVRNGLRYVKSLIDGKEPQYEVKHTDKETKLNIELGDEVVYDYRLKGVVVGIINNHKGEAMLSLLMRNYEVPQLVKESMCKTKTGRHFPQIIEVLDQLKEEFTTE